MFAVSGCFPDEIFEGCGSWYDVLSFVGWEGVVSAWLMSVTKLFMPDTRESEEDAAASSS